MSSKRIVAGFADGIQLTMDLRNGGLVSIIRVPLMNLARGVLKLIVAAAVLGERTDGRTASVVILGAYSVAFVIRLLAGAPRTGAAR